MASARNALKGGDRESDLLPLGHMPIYRETLPIPSLPSLPYLSLDSGTPGPTVFLTGVIHGDEIGGGVVIEHLFEKMESVGLKTGRLVAFPCLNPEGRKVKERNIPGGEDLNRVFPGRKSGSRTEQIAETVFEKIVASKPALVIDLHNDWINSIPYAIVSNHDIGAGAKARDAAIKSNVPAILESGSGIKGALSDVLIERDIPALTLEVGGSGEIRPLEIAQGVEAVWNILEFLVLAEPFPARKQLLPLTAETRKLLRYSDEPKAPKEGLFIPAVKPGALVARGEMLGEVAGEKIQATENALVLGYTDNATVKEGEDLFAFGIL